MVVVEVVVVIMVVVDGIICTMYRTVYCKQSHAPTSLPPHTLIIITRYVPLGMAGWFAGCGIRTVHEMDWWQTLDHPSSAVQTLDHPSSAVVQVTFVPAQV